MRTCEVIENGVKCDHKFYAKGMCNKHYHRWTRHGDPLIVGKNQYTLQENWGTRKDTCKKYRTAHARVQTARGKASNYLCAQECGAQAAQWAYDHSDPNELYDWVRRPEGTWVEAPFSLNVDHYTPMCIPCHTSHDRQLAHSKVDNNRR